MYQPTKIPTDETPVPSELSDFIFEHISILPLVNIILAYSVEEMFPMYVVVPKVFFGPEIIKQIEDETVEVIDEKFHDQLSISLVLSDLKNIKLFLDRGDANYSVNMNADPNAWLMCKVPSCVVTGVSDIDPSLSMRLNINAKNIVMLEGKQVTNSGSCLKVYFSYKTDFSDYFWCIKLLELQSIYDRAIAYRNQRNYSAAYRCFSNIDDQINELKNKHKELYIYPEGSINPVDKKTIVAQINTSLKYLSFIYDVINATGYSDGVKDIQFTFPMLVETYNRTVITHTLYERTLAEIEQNKNNVFEIAFAQYPSLHVIRSELTRWQATIREMNQQRDFVPDIKKVFSAGKLLEVIEKCQQLEGTIAQEDKIKNHNVKTLLQIYIYRGHAALFMERFDIAKRDFEGLVRIRENTADNSLVERVYYLEAQVKLATVKIQAQTKKSTTDQAEFKETEEILRTNEKLLLADQNNAKDLESTLLTINMTLGLISSQFGFIFYEKDREVAKNHFEKALGYNQNNSYANLQLGIINYKEGKFEKAEHYLAAHIKIQGVLQNTPGMWEAYGYLGLVFCHQDQWSKAISYLQKAKGLGREEFDTALANAQKNKQNAGAASERIYSNPAGINLNNPAQIPPAILPTQTSQLPQQKR